MSIRLKVELLALAVVCGVGGFNPPVDAQSVPARNQSDLKVVSASVDTSAAKSEKLRGRVAAAMHEDPYLFDKHIEVGVANKAIVLRGFVLSAWDLREAIRVARMVAGKTPVIDELSIKEGGR
jgi:osmotically-inducible protein OsmY